MQATLKQVCMMVAAGVITAIILQRMRMPTPPPVADNRNGLGW
ncbi:hypothetical protein [Hydrogenovibrio sp. SC-1]|nr:hypothetical protein [Hydrogenovibrio sp. SC-1]